MWKNNMPNRTAKFAILGLFCCSFASYAENGQLEKISLEDCIRIALEKHQSVGISEAGLEIAEAQYQQAMSAYWPQISAQSNASRAGKTPLTLLKDNLPYPHRSALHWALWQVQPQPKVDRKPARRQSNNYRKHLPRRYPSI
jgi:hypothetical protein